MYKNENLLRNNFNKIPEDRNNTNASVTPVTSLESRTSQESRDDKLLPKVRNFLPESPTTLLFGSFYQK